MHTNETTDNYFLEIEKLDYNPSDFMELFNKYELEMYIDRNGNPFGLEICYDTRLLDEPVVQHYIHVFRNFGLQIGYEKPVADEKHTGVAGFQLARSQLQDRGLEIHRDGFRRFNITFPVSFPQHINFYESANGRNPVKYHYRDKIVCCNVGGAWHNVEKSPEPRLQFQLDGYEFWEKVPMLIERL